MALRLVSRKKKFLFSVSFLTFCFTFSYRCVMGLVVSVLGLYWREVVTWCPERTEGRNGGSGCTAHNDKLCGRGGIWVPVIKAFCFSLVCNSAVWFGPGCFSRSPRRPPPHRKLPDPCLPPPPLPSLYCRQWENLFSGGIRGLTRVLGGSSLATSLACGLAFKGGPGGVPA
jgi:hypothetical protein